jgi:hypothetical protein
LHAGELGEQCRRIAPPHGGFSFHEPQPFPELSFGDEDCLALGEALLPGFREMSGGVSVGGFIGADDDPVHLLLPGYKTPTLAADQKSQFAPIHAAELTHAADAQAG